MSDVALPTASAFRSRVIGLSFVTSGPALAMLFGSLSSLLSLTGAQWSALIGLTVLWAVALTPALMLYQWRLLAPVVAWLEGVRDAAHTSSAFARVMDLPRRTALVAAVGWLVPVVAVSAVLELLWPDWSAFQSGVLVAGGLAAGFVAGAFMIFLVKRTVAPVRHALSDALPEPALRETLVRPLGLRTKLLVSVVGVTVVSALFSVLLAHASALRAIDRVAIQWEGELLRGSADAGAPKPGAAFDGAFDDTLRVVELDLGSPEAGALLEPQIVAHLRRLVAAGEREGDSAGLPSHSVFAWRRAAEGGERVRLVALPRERLAVDVARTGALFGLLFAVSTAIAVGLSWLLAGDVAGATEALRAEARRLASGDLRRGRVWESEDELGRLWRSFEAMGASLRATLGRVAEAADRVEATAGEMAEVASSVLDASADQARGIQRTTASMEALGEQVRGIADSSAALSVSVEESSSSVLELGAAGEELRATAGVLSERVSEVSASIEQLVRSVRQVVGTTEALSSAAEETSASMEEMAASLREVDSSAEQTARLSREVVDSAETGRTKFEQALDGMEAIRAATGAAEGVVRTLGERTREIGAVVDVIDDVAEETNLLALNAAIIAAQAGEHGRAFSVVADEIKDLAERVLSSTKEIGALIRSVQAEGAAAIGAIERGSRSVAVGSELWAAAGSSWDAITRASRESGERMDAVLVAVREQSRAAGHVVGLMERVRDGVEAIRSSSAEQDRGNEVISRSSVAMRDAALQVRGTTEEQARGANRIRESVEGVREAVERINGALQEQSAASRSAVKFLEAVWQRTQSNERSAGRLSEVSRGLVEQAEGLREHVSRFRIDGPATRSEG